MAELALYSVPAIWAALDWLALWNGWRRLDYLAKPAVIITLGLVFWRLASPAESGTRYYLVALALGFSLVGDVLLMLPREQFLGGLAAFLMAHLFYIIAFSEGVTTIWLPGAVLIALPVSAAASWLFREIRRALLMSGRRSLIRPVAVYSFVISLMLLSALATSFRPDTPTASRIWLSLGAALFFASDALLAWNRFVRPLPAARLIVRISYHTGQILLVMGFTLMLAGPV